MNTRPKRGANAPIEAAVLLAAAMAVGLASPAAGQATSEDPREAKPERPTVATHAYVVAPGIVELETGIQFQRPVPASSLFSLPVLFKIGLGERVQLDIAPGFVRTSSGDLASAGLGDAQVGVKWHLADRAPVVGAFALQALLKLPAGSVSKGTGTGTTDLNLSLISSHTFGPFVLDVNAGYTLRSGDGSEVPTSATSWTCSSGVALTERIGWVAEVFGYPGTTGPSGAPAIVALLTGPTLVVDKRFVIDAGAIFNLTGFGGTAIYAGLTWNMGRAWTPATQSSNFASQQPRRR
jgi:hypothetical protein